MKCEICQRPSTRVVRDSSTKRGGSGKKHILCANCEEARKAKR